MAQDIDDIVIGANGQIYVGPIGTPLPNGLETLDAAFVELGFVSEDGVTVVDAKTLFVVPVWQMLYPARRGIEGRDFTAAFALRQLASRGALDFAFGGGDFSAVTGVTGVYAFEPPDAEVVDERILVIDWQDGDYDFRLVMKRGLVTEDVETQLVRNAAADLPITFGIIGEAGVKPWRMISNHPGFAP